MNSLYKIFLNWYSNCKLKNINKKISFFKEYNKTIKPDLEKDKLAKKPPTANIRYALIKINNTKLEKLLNKKSYFTLLSK